MVLVPVRTVLKLARAGFFGKLERVATRVSRPTTARIMHRLRADDRQRVAVVYCVTELNRIIAEQRTLDTV